MDNKSLDIETATEEEMDILVASLIGESEDIYIMKRMQALERLQGRLPSEREALNAFQNFFNNRGK